jgi:hypothetical protein
MNNVTPTPSGRDIRIQLALDNWDAYVAQLTTMSDNELSMKLDVINMQAEIAIRNNITSSVELLEIWWRQVVEARILKEENNIPDAPNEIDLAIADIETTVAKAEEREETLRGDEAKHRNARPKIKEDNSDQMSLF